MPKPWGQPVLSLRLPAEDINGLKQLATDRQQTVTGILKEMIEDLLRQEGVRTAPKQLDGQITIDA